MKRVLFFMLVCLPPLLLGCQQEPATQKERVEQAQEELAETREKAAELIGDAEREAIDEIAEAKQDAESMVERAEEELTEQLGQLADPAAVLDDQQAAPVVIEPAAPSAVEPTATEPTVEPAN